MHKFILDKLEVRSEQSEGGNKIVIKGFAAAPDVPHIYKFQTDKETGKVVKSFKSLFTRNAIDSMERQMKFKNVFVDELHSTASFLNSKSIIESLKERVDDDIKKELNVLESQLSLKELPLFKPVHFEVLDDGLFVEIESNPHFAEVDEAHKNYYSAIMGSIIDKYLNGLSINFKAKEVVFDEGIEKINDVDLFGISIVPNASLGEYSGITDVAVRSMIEVRSEKMEEKKEQAPREDIDRLVKEMVEKRLAEENVKRQEQEKIVQVEKEKAEQEKMLNSLKAEMEELKKTQQAGSKGYTPTEKVMDEETMKQKVRALNFQELMNVKAEFDSKLPRVVIDTVPAKNKNDPSFHMVLKPLDGSMEQLYSFNSRKQVGDMVLPKERM